MKIVNSVNCTLTNAFTANDLKKAVDNFNNKTKQIIILNSKDAEIIKDSVPDIKDRFIIKAVPYIERNKCYIINQENLNY